MFLVDAEMHHLKQIMGKVWFNSTQSIFVKVSASNTRFELLRSCRTNDFNWKDIK